MPFFSFAEARTELIKLEGDYWSWKTKEFPTFATAVGVHEYDDRLETFTLEAFDNRIVSMRCTSFIIM